MTTAHRPTFDPARGKDAQRGPAFHQRLLPAHTVLKHRQPGQGTETETNRRDLLQELLEAEAAHEAKKSGHPVPSADRDAIEGADERGTKRAHGAIEGVGEADVEDADEDAEAKRRRTILEEAAGLDRDEEDSEEDSDEESDEDEDEEALLLREMAQIRKERAEKAAREEAEKAEKEEEQRVHEIARGNPLLNPNDFTVKRRWDDDVVFKNQARGTEDRNKKTEFVNDLLRSDFHKRFMSKYVR
ncbi:Cwf15/Cwc15 cell cycle control protein [Eremomyces bilateralis CBS 781.70]|uniref:Cwf15/Cwc15 cell cycle control protein n=1 Tax=Eremomyces bilateralis CBS 781.70 TaxID=1392243 RepID=A0A6G1FTS2_9PEZI|nr:Cwf15/Cwc15 cell cycle control protein [Eremomyces bilateralis CBS 781.70]KAF1809197.1 Cwf15/Cwc15 cell cycle control protein [Eremomyces bilateralis CBS 781.70]